MREFGRRPGIFPEGSSHPTKEASPVKLGRLERFDPSNIIVEAVSPDEALLRTLPLWSAPLSQPDFTDTLLKSVIDLVRSNSTYHVRLKIGSETDGRFREIELDNATGEPFDLLMEFRGDWEKKDRIPPGIGLKVVDKENAGQKEIDRQVRLWRRLNPRQEPLIQVGDRLEPGATLMLATRGKSIKRRLKLPKDKFPKGGIVTAIMVDPEDNNEEYKKKGYLVNGEFVFAYVDPIK